MNDRARHLLARLACIAFTSFVLALPTAFAGDSDLVTARELVQAGRSKEAWPILERLEPGMAGELAFDYLYGVAALDSGHPDIATFAFERVLAADPNYAGARLDLARAYFDLGNDDQAQQQFTTVLHENPPPQARAAAEKYLKAIAAHRTAATAALHGYVDWTLGHDSNITSVTADFSGAVLNSFGIAGVQPTGNSVRRQDMYWMAGGGLNYRYPFDRQSGWYTSLDGHRKLFTQQTAYDTGIGNLQTGYYQNREDGSLRVGYTAQHLVEPGQYTGSVPQRLNRDTQGLNVEWRHNINPATQVGLFAEADEQHYADLNADDVNQYTAGLFYVHVFAGARHPTLFASVFRTNERALRALPNGSDYSKNISGMRLSGQVGLTDTLDGFASAGYQWRDDTVASARLAGVLGQDRLMDLTAGLRWQLTDAWQFQPTVTYSQNDSNIALYQYRRVDLSATVRRNF